jgi:hypothetical protein
LLRPLGVDPQSEPEDRILNDLPVPDDFEDPFFDQDSAETDPSSAPSPPALTAAQLIRITLAGLGLGLLGFVWWRVRQGFRLGLFLERVAMAVPVRLEKSLLRLGIRPPGFLRDWARYASLPPLRRSYQEVNRALYRLGEQPPPTDTPAERVGKLAALLPEAVEPAVTLLGEYHDDLYSPDPGDENIARQAGQAVRQISYRDIFRRFFARLRSPFERK